MTTPVQEVEILIDSFSLTERIEWKGLQLHLILNFVLSLSVGSALHDLRVIFMTLGVFLVNLLGVGLRMVLDRSRPDPYDVPGQPCAEMLAVSFMVTYWFYHAYWNPKTFDPLTGLTLVGVVAWVWVALETGGHYFRSHIVGGLWVGILMASFWFYLWREVARPKAVKHVSWWNSRTPTFCHLCYDDNYDLSVLKVDMGFGNIPKILFSFFVITLIHP